MPRVLYENRKDRPLLPLFMRIVKHELGKSCVKDKACRREYLGIQALGGIHFPRYLGIPHTPWSLLFFFLGALHFFKVAPPSPPISMRKSCVGKLRSVLLGQHLHTYFSRQKCWHGCVVCFRCWRRKRSMSKGIRT